MGLFEDVVRRIVVELLAPALKKTREAFGIQYTAVIAHFGAKIQLFVEWIANSNISIFQWVRNEIQKAIDKIDTGGWSFNFWIQDIINAVFNAVKHLFVRIGDLISSVQDVIADWWVDTLASVKKVISATVDTAIDVVKTSFQKAVDVVADTIAHVAETISSTIAKIVDSFTNAVNSILENLSSVMNTIADTLLPAISNLQDSITDLGVSVAEDILETGNKFADLLLTEIDKVMKYIDEEVPKMVGGLFDWALPIVKPIQDAVGFLQSIANLITGNYPDDPQIRKNINEREEQQEKIDEIVERGRSGS